MTSEKGNCHSEWNEESWVATEILRSFLPQNDRGGPRKFLRSFLPQNDRGEQRAILRTDTKVITDDRYSELRVRKGIAILNGVKNLGIYREDSSVVSLPQNDSAEPEEISVLRMTEGKKGGQ